MLTNKIKYPTLLLDKNKCLENIRAMQNKAVLAGVKLRPHFKTHQSREVGNWFRDFGTDRIAVSSLRMAAYFAADNWKDITVAIPVNLREMDLINDLAGKTKLNLAAESLESLQYLDKKLSGAVNIVIEIDPGYHRTGLEWDQTATIDEMIAFIQQSDYLHFEGLLSHAGHSYYARNQSEILTIHKESTDLFQKFAERYRSTFPNIAMSLGDTPTCSTADSFPGATEIRPGNFVFYDLTQHYIGACNKEQIAVAMACPVIASHPSRNQLIIYGGGVHFSKDKFQTNDGTASFGEMVFLNPDGSWEIPKIPIQVISLSQEHGIIQGDSTLLEKCRPGDLVGVLPIHSCMTADCMKSYLSLDGKKIDMFKTYEW